MSLLSRGQAALIARQQRAAVSGNTLTYTRRGSAAVDLTNLAWTGRTVFASNLEGGARIEFGDRDYLIPVANLATLGEPRTGDRIAETIDGVVYTFEIMTPDTGEPSWRYSDQSRTVYRVHTKQVKSSG